MRIRNVILISNGKRNSSQNAIHHYRLVIIIHTVNAKVTFRYARYVYFRWISPIFRNAARLRRGNWIGGAFGHAECAENASFLEHESPRKVRGNMTTILHFRDMYAGWKREREAIHISRAARRTRVSRIYAVYNVQYPRHAPLMHVRIIILLFGSAWAPQM